MCVCACVNESSEASAYSFGLATNPNPTRAQSYPLNINPKPDPNPRVPKYFRVSGRVSGSRPLASTGDSRILNKVRAFFFLEKIKIAKGVCNVAKLATLCISFFSNNGLGLRSSQPRFEKHGQSSCTFFSVVHVIGHLRAESSQNACKEAVIQAFPLY